MADRDEVLEDAGFITVETLGVETLVRVASIVAVLPSWDGNGVSLYTTAGTIVSNEPYEAVVARIRAHYEP